MRLTADEIDAITDCARIHFGEGAVVRLFGSRLDDAARGGDIDLHVTAADDLDSHCPEAVRFKRALEDRIGEQRIDLLVNGPAGPRQPIERIALETGIVIPDPEHLPVRGIMDHAPGGNPCEPRIDVAELPHRELLSDAVRAGERTRANMDRLLAELSDKLPFTVGKIEALDWHERVRTDSLLQQFSNMVATVQDQLIRGILIATEEAGARQSRLDQRHVAEKLGALPVGLDFRAIIEARNGVAHQYPNNLTRQAKVLNDVVAAIPDLVRALTTLTDYAKSRGLVDP